MHKDIEHNDIQHDIKNRKLRINDNEHNDAWHESENYNALHKHQSVQLKLCVMIVRIRTFSIMTLSITLTNRKLRKMTLSIMTLGMKVKIRMLRISNVGTIDSQNNDTQHYA